MDDEELRTMLEKAQNSGVFFSSPLGLEISEAKAGADADDRLSMDLFYNVMRHKDSDWAEKGMFGVAVF